MDRYADRLDSAADDPGEAKKGQMTKKMILAKRIQRDDLCLVL